MAHGNFAVCLPPLLAHEGGYVDHPKDPGGATNLGITRKTLSDWLGREASKDEVKRLTTDLVAPIYKKKYWDVLNCETLFAGVDYATFDAGVNSGPRRAREWLMASLGGDGADTIKKQCAKRLSFLQALKNWKTFGRGWLRRVTEVEATALAMHFAALYPEAQVAKPALRDEAKAAESTATKQGGAAAGAGTAGTASAGGTVATTAPDQATAIDTWLAVGGTALLVALTIFLAYRFIVNRSRAEALTEKANALG